MATFAAVDGASRTAHSSGSAARTTDSMARRSAPTAHLLGLRAMAQREPRLEAGATGLEPATSSLTGGRSPRPRRSGGRTFPGHHETPRPRVGASGGSPGYGS